MGSEGVRGSLQTKTSHHLSQSVPCPAQKQAKSLFYSLKSLCLHSPFSLLSFWPFDPGQELFYRIRVNKLRWLWGWGASLALWQEEQPARVANYCPRPKPGPLLNHTTQRAVKYLLHILHSKLRMPNPSVIITVTYVDSSSDCSIFSDSIEKP